MSWASFFGPMHLAGPIIWFAAMWQFRWRVMTQANSKSKSEKFSPPHQDAAVGSPRDESHNGPVSFGPHDTSFSSSIFDPKSSVFVKSSEAMSRPSKSRKPKREEPNVAPSRRFIRSFIPSSIGLAMDLRFKGKESVSEGFGSRR
ncbi:uncharacterized protein LOC132286058 [Cornus florida]|uniref:uncharacterized protein LOC132286058 n=1 Tax=Cornus florida TaxID=4283 RepID=UPI00289C5B86|nr:uncharacterized protein LOC132286058 [Cornus florida]